MNSGTYTFMWLNKKYLIHINYMIIQCIESKFFDNILIYLKEERHKSSGAEKKS